MNSELHELLVENMQDLYDAEKQLVKALPKMIKAASNEDLRQGLTDHLAETEQQVQRLEQAFQHLEEKAKSKPCSGMKGIVEEGREAIEADLEEPVSDIALIGAARRVEHYEMAGYKSAISWARQMGHDEVVDLLQQTLDEETAADEKLSSLNDELCQGLESNDEDQEGVKADDTGEDEAAPKKAATAQKAAGKTRAANTRP